MSRISFSRMVPRRRGFCFLGLRYVLFKYRVMHQNVLPATDFRGDSRSSFDCLSTWQRLSGSSNIHSIHAGLSFEIQFAKVVRSRRWGGRCGYHPVVAIHCKSQCVSRQI